MIRASHNDNDCKPCKKVKAAKKSNSIPGIFTTALLVFLPKCPFCFMAYTSTAVLCGNGISVTSGHTFSSPVTLVVAIVFCVVAVLSILFNYRDKRTLYALLLATAGAAMVVYSINVAGGIALYYTGVILQFIGVWLNRSLFYILRKMQDRNKVGQPVSSV